MVATNLKAETMKLMEKRSSLEAEMDAIIQRLCQPGGPGLSGNLLDSEGFPRGDIDIPAIRASRQRLAELRNDHEDITEKINQNIQVLHSATLKSTTTHINESGASDQDSSIATPSVSSNSFAGSSSNNMDVDLVVSRPFAMVDEITEASPAAEDGLQLGDQIVKFGSVEIGANILQRLSAEAQNKQGQTVSLVVLRQGSLINMTVTPRSWSGRGLLGCHFRLL